MKKTKEQQQKEQKDWEQLFKDGHLAVVENTINYPVQFSDEPYVPVGRGNKDLSWGWLIVLAFIFGFIL